jgi:short-subunit dehydrogenase
MATIVMVGATSGIGSATAREFAQAGYDLVLAGRNMEKLSRLGADLGIRFGVRTEIISYDALLPEAGTRLYEQIVERFDPDGLIIFHGALPDPAEVNRDASAARECMEVNFLSVVELLVPFANHFEERMRGWIAVVGSVAGDRGRQSNYAYGAAKGGLAVYLQGLRNRLAPRGVHVLTVKPGLVDTDMTSGMEGLARRIMASPERVARDIYRAVRRRSNVVYTPFFWKYIMWIVRLIPESLFKNMKF